MNKTASVVGSLAAILLITDLAALRHLSNSQITAFDQDSVYTESSYDHVPGSPATKTTRMYLENVSFSQVKAILDKRLGNWRANGFVHDYRKYHLNYMQEANFERPDWGELVEVEYVVCPYGSNALILGDRRELSPLEFGLARAVTFGHDKMDGSKMYVNKCIRKPPAQLSFARP